MPLLWKRPIPLLAAAWVAGLVAFVAGLSRSAPLFVNVGAGDGPFAHGFRERWERDAPAGSGETMFRWAEDGSRLDLPLEVRGGRVSARIRLGRFAEREAEIVVESSGVEVDRWVQPPRGWRVREVDLGAVRGPIRLAFRTASATRDAMAVAVDWVEIRGVGLLFPPPGVTLRAAVFLLGPPLLVLALLRSHALAAGVGAFAAAVAATAVWLDRLGGLWACAEAAVPAVVVVLALALLEGAMRRSWPDEGRFRPVVVPILLALAALAALFHPFYYDPGVDTHGRFLQALRANPTLLVDPTQPWPRLGDVTREIGGQRVAIPYAMVFHAVSWPLSPVLGDTGALKTVAVLSACAVVLLVHALARAAALPPRWAVLAQVLAAALPVTTSRLSLALFPALFGQAFVVLLLVHLARRLAHLDGARDAAAATIFVLLAQGAYTGSLLMVPVLVAVLAAVEVARGDGRRALRLLGGWGVATALLMVTMYIGFLPTLWADVLPHLFERGAASPGTEGVWSPALRRLGLFFDVAFPLLAALGLVAFRQVPIHARRVLAGALAAGMAVLVARHVLPTALREAKDVELLEAPVAVLSTAGLLVLAQRGRLARALGALALAGGLAWALARDAALYAERFVAVGR